MSVGTTESQTLDSEAPLAFPLLVGCVDTGSNGIRLAIAQFKDLRTYDIIEYDRVPVRLGHEVFLSGRLSQATMDDALAVFRNYRERLDQKGVKRFRAVATSAVREASNGAEFLERVRAEANLDLERITGSEEARLVHLAVSNRIDLGDAPWLLVDLGGGSAEVSLVDAQGIRWVESHAMGSVRLLEELTTSGDDPSRFVKLLEEYAQTLRIPAKTQDKPVGYIATGGNIESLVRVAGLESPSGISRLPLAELDRLIERLAQMPYRERVERLGLKADRADVILPAAIIYARLGQLADATEILVPAVGVKDGLLLDVAASLTTPQPDHLEWQIQEAALVLGRKYQFDEEHATQVTLLSLSIFDQTVALHGLGRDSRRILQAAALLHEIGSFISRSGHHKHSMYLIAASGLLGFAPPEIEMVANVARYHRKSPPKPEHEAFQKLSKNDRTRVLKLAAILRVADSLDREHAHQVNQVKVKFDKTTVRLLVEGRGDLLLEAWSLRQRSDLFRTVFNRKVVLETGADAGP